MDQGKLQRQIDNAHRAIGHYIAEFSQLVACMRRHIAVRLTAGQGDSKLGMIPLGEIQAMQLSGAFFQMCRETNDLNRDERAVEKWLRNRVREVIEDRNNYAHGDWWVGLTLPSSEQAAEPQLVRIKPRPSEKRAEKIEQVPVDELDKKAAEIVALMDLVLTFGLICLEQPAVRPHTPDGRWRGTTETVRVGDVLVVQDGKVQPKPREPVNPQDHLRAAAARRVKKRR